MLADPRTQGDLFSPLSVNTLGLRQIRFGGQASMATGLFGSRSIQMTAFQAIFKIFLFGGACAEKRQAFTRPSLTSGKPRMRSRLYAPYIAVALIILLMAFGAPVFAKRLALSVPSVSSWFEDFTFFDDAAQVDLITHTAVYTLTIIPDCLS